MLNAKKIASIFLYFFASFFVTNKQCAAIEILLHTSKTYNAISLNGFDKYKLKTTNKLTKYYYDSDQNLKKLKEKNDSTLTPQQQMEKNDMTYKALADFRNPQFISSHRKSNPHLLTTSFGFGLGVAKVDFGDRNGKYAALHQQNLDNHNRTMLNATGGFVSFNVNIRGVIEFSFSPGLYNADFIKRIPSSSNATKYTEARTNGVVAGYAFNILFKPSGIVHQDGIVIGGGMMNINNVSKMFFSLGILLE